jgi:hypothetical protein
VLTTDALTAYIELLEGGQSPAAACGELSLTRDAVREALQADAALRERAGEVYAVLSENVLAALYRAATDGNVTAQGVWLKLHPPAGWGAAREAQPGPATFDSVLDGLSDEELDELARAVGGGLSDPR